METERENRFSFLKQRNKEGPSFQVCNSLSHCTAMKKTQILHTFRWVLLDNAIL